MWALQPRNGSSYVWWFWAFIILATTVVSGPHLRAGEINATSSLEESDNEFSAIFDPPQRVIHWSLSLDLMILPDLDIHWSALYHYNKMPEETHFVKKNRFI